DTAFWVATYRAMESERPDALFKDPYAELLSGEHGRQIVKNLGSGARNSWFLVARTCILDSWILKLIETEKIDTILNLAAGLDTRAYRLKLPSTLKWYDVDLPEILTYKESKLKDHSPSCQFHYVKMDLSNLMERRAFFEKVDKSATRTLVISEGFLMYLNPESAASLAKDLSQYKTFKFWLAEILGPSQLRWINLRWGKMLQRANSVMNFAPSEGANYFIPFDWKPLDFKASLVEAVRLRRAPRLYSTLFGLKPFLPKSFLNRFSSAGIALLANQISDKN
ncbi:MAG: class I SAM-dependent methyltransferase, partial [Deltaproteobacteria bacterium]